MPALNPKAWPQEKLPRHVPLVTGTQITLWKALLVQILRPVKTSGAGWPTEITRCWVNRCHSLSHFCGGRKCFVDLRQLSFFCVSPRSVMLQERSKPSV